MAACTSALQRVISTSPRSSAVVSQQRSLVVCSSRKPSRGGKSPGNRGSKSFHRPISNHDALVQSLGEVSKAQGRVSDRTNMVLGSDDTIEKWKELDQTVNEYPCQRQFKCVGVSEDGFQDSMVGVVEGVLGTSVHPEMIATRPSSQGKYISVQIGPVIVKTPDQVLAIFSGMKEDTRLKWVM
mmetsp:Transcript_23172/g.64352  ORF Transcript_23172/g.64352 Transcript_23172/m.64352 type:complete len:183 (-) Transcript_23172:399-947(-)|eukprot:CAMPEP_0117680830 /NCGR_PEP_ID=MMETSP0804-20121206/18593_1 /TAXON_ID=1074897 /ORGANISM="Tetraselmis astigmatica, Strain CCMP880" /LENGTH=182 /DNA_ID=CAMNT_0005490417 /DNA_START=116 /DNA_END=664 /DNA_ORIENTATION=+